MNNAMTAPNIAALVYFFENLAPDSLPTIDNYYTEDTYFRDPFNEFNSCSKLEAVFADMFHRLNNPKFTVTQIIAQENQCVLIWDFDFAIKSYQPNKSKRIHGSSHIRFAADGRANYHRDYWDAAGELYEQLPVVGAMMRWLKKRMG
jgi:steroid Delta-isomerase